MMKIFGGKKVSSGRCLVFDHPVNDDGSREWQKSEKLPFDVSKHDFTDKTLSASMVSSSNGSTRRASALRRSSCNRSVTAEFNHKSAALDLMDAEICTDHVLVNAERERVSNFLRPLRRSNDLDQLARQHATAMAKETKTFHTDATQVVSKLQKQPSQRLGENVARGKSIEYIHYKMTYRKSNYANMMDWRYSEMGMGTATGSDGKIYLCQLFRG